jgi:hypothetical protein
LPETLVLPCGSAFEVRCLLAAKVSMFRESLGHDVSSKWMIRPAANHFYPIEMIAFGGMLWKQAALQFSASMNSFAGLQTKQERVDCRR